MKRSRWFHFSLAVLLGLSLALCFRAHAQISLSPVANSAASVESQKPWWDFSRANRCGRYWCSQVLIPYRSIDWNKSKMIVAVEGGPNISESESALLAEQRSQTIVESFNGVLKQYTLPQSLRIGAGQLENYGFEQGFLAFRFWLFTNPKPPYLDTPKVAIGVQNNSTVIFVLAQSRTGTAQQIIMTVTDADAKVAGLDKADLALLWTNDLQSAFDSAVWGLVFNRYFPMGRVLLVVGALFLGSVGIIYTTRLRSALRDSYRAVQSRLNALEKQVKRDGMPTSTSSELLNNEHDLPSQTFQPSENMQGFVDEDEGLSPGYSRWHHLHRYGTAMYSGVKRRLTRVARAVVIGQRFRERRSQSRRRILLQVLQLLRISLLIASIMACFLIVPQSRILATALAQQAALLLLIWLSVSISQLLSDLTTEHVVSQWVIDSLVHEPSSVRYELRSATYIRVLKGISRLLLIVLGTYASLLTIGIDPNLLAGAGLIAVGIGFLSRNLLEDMINGIMILSTDRFAIGDVISVGESSGFVASMNLSATQLRSADGELITIPNREISTVSNLTKDWSRVNFEVDVSTSADLGEVLSVVRDVADRLYSESPWCELILKPIEILGFDQIDHSGSKLRVWITTSPLQQWAVGREFRLRIKEAFDAHQIELGRPQRTLELRSQSLPTLVDTQLE